MSFLPPEEELLPRLPSLRNKRISAADKSIVWRPICGRKDMRS